MREEKRLLEIAGVFVILSLLLGACDEEKRVSKPEGSRPKTYKVVFPFKAPSTADERYVFGHNDVVTYMNWLRTKYNVKLAKAFAEAYVKTSIKTIASLVDEGAKTELTPYIPLEDINTYNMSKSSYQGTRVDAKPSFYQEDQTGKLIPVMKSGTEVLSLRRARKPKNST